MPSLGKAWKYSHGVGLGGFAALGAGKAMPVFAPAAGIHPHPITQINPLSGCSPAGAQPALVCPTEASHAAKPQ